MKIVILPILSLIILTTILSAQSSPPPKREFRAVWVATVSNIDWPSSKNLSTSLQKNEVIAILDKHKANNVNAIVFQIRPSCDAFYQNGKEPLSEWLVGEQGGNLSLYYDPLQFWIDEAHKRGMELHAWFNPYRSVVSSTSSVHNTHISKTKPEWNITYGASPYKFLDPGLPPVQEYVVSVIMDVVRRYNIDGVHFDDYFYPYGGMTNQDSATYANYKGAFTNIGDWRRNNVNKFIAMVHDSIKAVKPWVKYGISPFGIWKNSAAGTNGLDAYSAVYCDAVNWLTNKKVDYLTPQVYWAFARTQAPYGTLVPWWQTVLNGRHLYVGHGAYNMSSTSAFPNGSWPASELADQVRFNRNQTKVLGSVFFSSKVLTGNTKGFADTLKNDLYRYPAIHPAMPWLDSIPPIAPVNLVATVQQTGVSLQWQKPATASDNDTAHYFAVYRAQSPDTINANNPRYILAITTNDSTRYVDATVVNGATYSYLVTSFDKLDNESEATAKINLTVTGVKDIISVPLAYRLDQNFPNPFNPATTISFTLQVSGFTSLKVYDVLGREVATVVDGLLEVGYHTYQFSGANLASGVYIYRIISGNFAETKKMVLQK